MEWKDKIVVVVPTLDEAHNLAPLLLRICCQLEGCELPFEVVVVDDDSHDGTEAVVRQAAERDSRIRLLTRRGERGLAGAILHGWENSDATILGVMDADLQHPPELLPCLLAEVQSGNDVVLGSRYVGNGKVGSWNPVRRLLSAMAVWATLPLQPRELRVKDPMSGYFLVRRRCVDNIEFQQAGFKLLLEILVRGHVRSVREVPFTFGRRGAGRSKASLKVAWEYVRLLVRLYAVRWSRGRVVEVAPGD